MKKIHIIFKFTRPVLTPPFRKAWHHHIGNTENYMFQYSSELF